MIRRIIVILTIINNDKALYFTCTLYIFSLILFTVTVKKTKNKLHFIIIYLQY